jgi:hypothetical protein
MGWACVMHDGEMYTGIWWGNVKETDYLENLSVDERIILKYIRKT